MADASRVRMLEDFGGLELIEARHDCPRFPRHAHATYALGVVGWGLNRFNYRGAFHTAPAGAICTVTPDEAHAVEPAGDIGFAYRCLYPSIDLVQRVAESVGGRRLTHTLAWPPVIEDSETLRLAVAYLETLSGGQDRLERESRLFSLLACVLTRHATRPVVPRQRLPSTAAAARAREYLSEHSTENVSLDALGALTGVDPWVLLRAFRRAYGLPPHAWLVQERVRRAQTALLAGIPPAQVARQVGFADQSHLNRHFRRIVGVTPGAYRAAITPSAFARPRRAGAH